MDLGLKDKIIIVSGAVRGAGSGGVNGAAPGALKGIGESIVDVLAREGATPFIADGDLTRPGDCEMAVKMAIDQYGRIDGLVNNTDNDDRVGLAPGLESGSYEDFMSSLNGHLVQYYLLAYYALPALKATRGCIVNIGSKTAGHAEQTPGGVSGSAAVNGGRNALTREWAVELLKYGIRVNAVLVSERDSRLGQHTMTSLAAAEEIAWTTAFLLSPCSSHTTGQLIHVKGEINTEGRNVEPK